MGAGSPAEPPGCLREASRGSVRAGGLQGRKTPGHGGAGGLGEPRILLLRWRSSSFYAAGRGIGCRALGGITGPATAPAPGYRHPWRTPNFGYLHPRVVPPRGGSVTHSRAISVPPVSPSPCYRHRPRNLPAGYSRLWSISVSGVPQSPGNSRLRWCLSGVSLSPFPGVFPPPRYPHPRLVSSPCGVFLSPGYPHPGPLVSCAGPRGAALPQDGWAGGGLAGRQAPKWLGAARHPPRSLPRGLHNVS